MFSPVLLFRMEPISLGETDTATGFLDEPYSTPGISPATRNRRLTFLPVSVRFLADTTMSAIGSSYVLMTQVARFGASLYFPFVVVVTRAGS